MKKIFAFIGSPLKEKSNTYTLTKMMLDRLKSLDKDIQYEILTSGQVKINYCLGCWTCMTKGFCPQDKLDDMGMLKEKMMAADFIIWGSPVYIMHVSGQMKTFLDRLCCWFHLIKLAGKPGLTVATTGQQGLETIHEYFEMLLGSLGVVSVGRLDAVGYYERLKDPQEAQRKAEDAAKQIYPYIIGERVPQSNKLME